MSNDPDSERRRLTPWIIATVFIVPITLLIGAYGVFKIYDYYKWAYKPKVVAQEIVLNNFDSWLSNIPDEHREHYEALREIAAQDNHRAETYYVIGIRMLDQISDGRIDDNEVQTVITLRAAIDEYESMRPYFEKMYQEPNIVETGRMFWDLGALPVRVR